MNNPIHFAKPTHEKRVLILFVTAVASVMAGLVTLLTLGNDGQLDVVGGLLIAFGAVSLATYSARHRSKSH